MSSLILDYHGTTITTWPLIRGCFEQVLNILVTALLGGQPWIILLYLTGDDWFQSQGLRLMKTNPSIVVGGIHKPGHINDLDQLDLAEVDGEGDWLAVDDEEMVEEEEPEITPEKVVFYLPSNFTLQQRKEYGL